MVLLLLSALAAEPQVVRFEVAAPGHAPALGLRVETTWLGEERALTLRDDGSTPGDAPGDGVFVGELSGEPVRALPVRLVLEGGGHRGVEVYAGLERVFQPADRLAWALSLGDAPVATRVAAPYLARSGDSREVAWVAASIGWVCLLLGYVAWLLGRRLPA